MLYRIISNTEEIREESWPKPLMSLLEEFQDVFMTPKEFPPCRSCDHRIPPVNPQLIVNERIYRYPFH